MSTTGPLALAGCDLGPRLNRIRAARPSRLVVSAVLGAVNALRALGIPTATGRFGAMMQVELVNDGPVTLIVDSK